MPLDSTENLLLQLLNSTATQTGIRIDALKAMGVGTVYACCNVLGKTVGTLPIKVYQKVGTNREERSEHPIASLLSDAPNDEMTSTDFLVAMQGTCSLRNSSYAQIVRTNAGEISELWPLPYNNVQVIRQNGDLKYQIEGKGILDKRDVLHLRGYTQNGITGLDPVSTVGDVFGLAVALDTNAAKFFGNNSRPGASLEVPGALSDTAYKRLKDSLDAEHKGVSNAYKLLILEEGMKFAQSRVDNNAAQFNESREHQAKIISALFGVPPHKVGLMKEATFSNIVEQERHFITTTIRPILVQWEKTIALKLLTKAERMAGYYVRFKYEHLLKGDIEKRFAAYAQGRQWGFLSVNEIRALEDMNPVDGGDTYLEPLNMAPAGTQEELQNERNE